MSPASVVMVSNADALARLRKDLRIDGSNQYDPLKVLVASIVRRLAGFMCPCPAHALGQAAKRSLTHFEPVTEDLDVLVENTVDDLSVCGDLLELADVVVAGAEGKPTWLFCAQPSFVERPGRVYIFGIAPDDAPFLPLTFRSTLQHLGATRYIETDKPEKLGERLKSLGLRPIDKKAWLSIGQPESAQAAVGRAVKRLGREGISGELPDIKVLAHATNQVVPYGQRWLVPSNQSDVFVCRSPQPYGAPLWYVAQLKDGVTVRSLLLPTPDSSLRACDAAWQIQLAFDAARGSPNRYKVRVEDSGCRIDCSFPLPLAARRRLLIIGGGRQPEGGGPNAFWIPSSQLREEEQHLQANFWLSRDN